MKSFLWNNKNSTIKNKKQKIKVSFYRCSTFTKIIIQIKRIFDSDIINRTNNIPHDHSTDHNTVFLHSF